MEKKKSSRSYGKQFSLSDANSPPLGSCKSTEVPLWPESWISGHPRPAESESAFGPEATRFTRILKFGKCPLRSWRVKPWRHSHSFQGLPWSGWPKGNGTEHSLSTLTHALNSVNQNQRGRSENSGHALLQRGLKLLQFNLVLNAWYEMEKLNSYNHKMLRSSAERMKEGAW